MKFSSTESRIFLTTICAAIFLAACASRTSDEERVRELIASVEAAAEARDTSDVLALVADDYSDARGFDKPQLQNFLRGYFLSHPKIELLVNVESLEFPADGLARARVALVSVPLDRVAAGDSITLAVELRRADGEWRVSRADRESR